MEAARQDMEQEPADELVCGERHDLLARSDRCKPSPLVMKTEFTGSLDNSTTGTACLGAASP
jgi:hypothetical protein